MPDNAARARDAGFTLVELIVALALFALISLAGVSLVESIIGVQQRTEGRLDRLGDLQRAMYVVTSDFEQVTGDVSRRGPAVRLVRSGVNGPVTITYSLAGGGLRRTLDGRARTVVTGVDRIEWRFHKPGRGWLDEPSSRDDATRPEAIELTLLLAPRDGAAGGAVRRLVALPGEAR